RAPPAILKAGIVKPNPAKIHWPKTAKTPRVIVAVRQAFDTICCFWKASMSSVRTEKKGTTPRGSTIAKMEAMAVAPNAQSTMVFLGFGRSVLTHQLHPAAALVHGEVAAVRGPHEFVPGDDLELVAGALGKAQRARANHLARLEPLDGDVTMASDKPSPFLVEAVKASASRFKETKNALEARQKELDAREAELETRATDLERKAERLKGERDDFQKEKEQVTAARATID